MLENQQQDIRIQQTVKYLVKSDCTINCNRNCTLNCVQAYYKRVMRIPSLLYKNLVIEFAGEEGLDAGALRNEFFWNMLAESG